MIDKLKVVGVFTVKVYDKDGNLKHEEQINNLVTNEGKNHLLDVGFHAVAATATWYCGLISNASYTGIAVTDTMASHAGWTEFTNYSQANRVEWTEGAAASQSITNAAAMAFSITGSGTLKGGFIVSNNTKGGSTGILWSSVLFAADIPVNNGDTVNVTYTINLS